jgi:hypothetical protein
LRKKRVQGFGYLYVAHKYLILMNSTDHVRDTIRFALFVVMRSQSRTQPMAVTEIAKETVSDMTKVWIVHRTTVLSIHIV